MNRKRAACILLNDENLLLMFRNNNGNEYYTFIGGGVEENETPEKAVVRETKEESSVDVEVERLLYEIHRKNGERHYFFLCRYLSGTPEVAKGTKEYTDNMTGNNIYAPGWYSIEALDNLLIYPEMMKHKLLIDLKNGFPLKPQVIKTD